MKHQKITESLREKLIIKKDFYEQKLAMITLILKKQVQKKEQETKDK